MANHHGFYGSTAALFIAVIVVVGSFATNSAHAAKKIELKEEKKMQILKEEEKSIKKQDKEFRKQAKAQANMYRKTANEVKKYGGDPTALLNAAAYFDNQAK
ncbi:MAG: hypothetical protein CTY13_01985 [Methylobacter sp.]|nr:MAG: hypothetical protein CTY13_01985 [Methylobacter sp.]